MSMHRLSIGFPSETLTLQCSLTALVPADRTLLKNRDIPILWLLHGLSDDHTMWERMTSIERYADARGLAVIMPAVGRSWYTNMRSPATARYRDFLADEVPAVVRSLLPVSSKRERNYIAGLSMGGYGALKLALLHPDRYAFAASLSGAVDIASRFDTWDRSEITAVFGSRESLAASDDDLFRLVDKRVHEGADLPEIMLACGTEDFLHEDNLRFRDLLASHGVAHTYQEEPGTHDWEFWDRWIQRVIDRLPIPTV